MSNRRAIEGQLRSLREINEILNAMKNLSLMEVHKLARFLASQRKVVENIEAAAADFLQFHPLQPPGVETPRELYLLIGSERGFCGDFNYPVIRVFEPRTPAAREQSVIVVGNKLAAKFSDDPRLRAGIGGASVAEEVDSVLGDLTRALALRSDSGLAGSPLRLTVVHHQSEEGGVVATILQPLPTASLKPRPYSHPPLLYLEPREFLSGLVEQYLLAALHELLYGSLMAENQRRMQQMDSAVRRLEKSCVELGRKRNILRQEEITEEIEVIMLSMGALG